MNKYKVIELSDQDVIKIIAEKFDVDKKYVRKVTTGLFNTSCNPNVLFKIEEPVKGTDNQDGER